MTTRTTNSRRTRKICGGGRSLDDPELYPKILFEKVNAKPYRMSHVQAIRYLIQFLNKEGVGDILETHKDILNHFDPTDFDDIVKTLNENAEWRKFACDIIRWLILDYSNELVNSILKILMEAISSPNFFAPSAAPPFKNNGLLLIILFLCKKIKELSSGRLNRNIDLCNLLRLILKILMFYMDTLHSTITDEHMTVLSQYKETIICVLKYCIKNNTTTSTVTKDLLIKFMDEMKFDWAKVLTSNMFLSLDVAKSCATVFAHESAAKFTAMSIVSAKNTAKAIVNANNKTRKVVRNLLGFKSKSK